MHHQPVCFCFETRSNAAHSDSQTHYVTEGDLELDPPASMSECVPITPSFCSVEDRTQGFLHAGLALQAPCEPVQ